MSKLITLLLLAGLLWWGYRKWIRSMRQMELGNLEADELERLREQAKNSPVLADGLELRGQIHTFLLEAKGDVAPLAREIDAAIRAIAGERGEEHGRSIVRELQTLRKAIEGQKAGATQESRERLGVLVQRLGTGSS